MANPSKRAFPLAAKLVLGMALVIAGLAAVTFVTQRGVFKGG